MDGRKNVRMEPKNDTFECQLCGLTAPYSYYGHKPPNAYSVTLLEDCYVMKDPFTPDKDKFLILGSQCSLCHKRVCAGPTTPEKVQILRGWSLAEKTCQELPEYEQIASDVIGNSRKLWPAARPDCSLFYSKRFCLPCVNAHISEFPMEIEEDLKKKAHSKSSKKGDSRNSGKS